MTQTSRTPTTLVDDLARLAAGAEPAPLDESGARRLVERALEAEAASPAPRRVPWRALAVGAAAAAVVAWLYLRPTPSPALLALSLPTGDRVVGVAGAELQIERIEPEHRRIRVQSGTLLFDVARAAPRQELTVVTPDFVATSQGAVFSASITPHGSQLSVYAGSVEIIQAEVTHTLVAGDAWTSASGAVRARPPKALVAAVADAVARRSGRPEIRGSGDPVPGPSPASTPTPTPTPAPAPAPTLPPRSPDLRTSGPPDLRSLDLPSARAALAAGDYAKARALATRQRSPSAAWLLILGDAERGLDHAGPAADAYDAAARALGASADAIEPAYTAAYLRFTKLSDSAGALAALVPATYAEASPLEERALALRAQILAALGRADEASAAATRYLERFPHGDLRTVMLRLRATAAP